MSIYGFMRMMAMMVMMVNLVQFLGVESTCVRIVMILINER